MSRSNLSRACLAGFLALLVACGGGGGGGSKDGTPVDSTALDPAVDFFLTGASFGRPILDLSGSLTDLVNPASLFEIDPLTGIGLPGFPKVLNAGTSLTSLASLNLAQILDPLTPQVPLIPRNAALVLEFSMPVSAPSVNLLNPEAGETNLMGSQSTIQILRKTGELVPARGFVDGKRVILIGLTEDSLGFEASPLVFDQTGTVVEDISGFMRIVMGSGVGAGALVSDTGLPFKTRPDKLGSTFRPFPMNPGNAALDAIILQTDTGKVTFNGFLPDVTSPRIVRPVEASGVLASFGSVGGQVELRDSTLGVLPNVSANAGLGEWANALVEITSNGGLTTQYVIESNRNEAGTAVFRLEASEFLDPSVSVGDAYVVSRTEFFEPIPPPFPSSPAALAAITVDPVSVPRDPFDPQDQFNSDLRYFVRMFGEDGVEHLDRWNSATGTFLSVPPRTSLRIQFSEGMDVDSFNPYETFYITDGSLPVTDPAFESMRVGRSVAFDNGSAIEFQPYLEDQVDPTNSRFIGFGGTASQLRLVLRTLPSEVTISELKDTATGAVLAQLLDLQDLGVAGCIDLGGRGFGLPPALLDQGDNENFFLSSTSPARGPFPPAVDVSMVFETQASSDIDYGVVVHRFQGQAQTSLFSYPTGVVHDTVVAGVEFKDFPPIDEDNDGTIDRRFIYGPQVVEVGLNIPGRLTGAPASVIQHLIDDNNPPKPSPVSSPNGEDFLISLGFGVSTPINSAYGARFQHIYRPGDASPAKSDFTGVVLDLVGLAWSPFNDPLLPTVLDDFELLVGLSGMNGGRGPDTNQTNGIPANGNSGLKRHFDCNQLDFWQNCNETLTPNFQAQLAEFPQPDTTVVVKKGTPYTINSTNLFKPSNSGSGAGTFNQYLDYPTFNAGFDPFFEDPNVFSFPYDSRFPMLIEYSIGPNASPPPTNLYRFSPGILTSVLPRFRIWSQGQHPAAHGVANVTINSGNFLPAGEGGPLLKPGCYSSPVTPQEQHNGMPTQLPLAYITPPRDIDGNLLQTSRDANDGVLDGNGCLATLPTPNSNPESNFYFASGALINPLPDPTSYPGPNGQPPTFWFGYGVPAAVSCNLQIPIALAFSNNPNVLSNEPGMTAPPSRYGDNARYYMMWKYRKRVSIIESPTLEVDGATVRYQRPIINPPLSSVDPLASLAVDFRAGRQLDFAVAQLESGYVRSDEPDFSALLSGPDDQYTFVKFRASFGVAPSSTQPPLIDSIIIPYEKVN